MRATVVFVGLTVSVLAPTESVGSNRIKVAVCDTKGALQCQSLLKDCLQNCKTNDNQSGCRQICLGHFRGCKNSAGCSSG
jgi:hypothetical protein